MAVGHLILYPNKSFEFKTSGSLNLNNSRLRGGSTDILQQLETVKSMGKKNFEQLAAERYKSKNQNIQSLIKNAEEPPPEYHHLSNFLKE